MVCILDISESEDYYFNKKNIKRMPYVYAQIALTISEKCIFCFLVHFYIFQKSI